MSLAAHDGKGVPSGERRPIPSPRSKRRERAPAVGTAGPVQERVAALLGPGASASAADGEQTSPRRAGITGWQPLAVVEAGAAADGFGRRACAPDHEPFKPL
jgi:hypothetical protein